MIPPTKAAISPCKLTVKARSVHNAAFRRLNQVYLVAGQTRSATTRKIPAAPSAAGFLKLAAAALTCSQGYANARQSAPAGRSLLQAGDVRQETAALDFGVATPAVSDGRDGTPSQALQLC